MFLTNVANDVPLSIWYDWRDDGDDPKEGEHHFGIVRRKYRDGEKEVFTPKPAYTAMRVLSEELRGLRLNKRLFYSAEPLHVLLFGESKNGRIAGWCEAGRGWWQDPLMGELKQRSLTGEIKEIPQTQILDPEAAPKLFDEAPSILTAQTIHPTFAGFSTVRQYRWIWFSHHRWSSSFP
jgi:hypothetical protein